MRNEPCGRNSTNVQLYLDNELSGSAYESFCMHLNECPYCRDQVESEQTLSELLRRARPLYSASEELRARVESMVTEHAAGSGHGRLELRQRFFSLFGGPVQSVWRPVMSLRMIAAGLAVIALVLGVVPNVLQHVRAAEYLDTAVSAHRSYLSGQLPLQLVSDSPGEIAAWFDGKVPFHFQLPASQLTTKETSPFRPSGARVVSFRGRDAALVVYHSQLEQVSLLVASSKSAKAADGDELRSNGLIFHYVSKGGFNVVTWTTHDLTYALVSSLHGSAQHSCLVCHQNMHDQNEFR